jgi:hypothetical protein
VAGLFWLEDRWPTYREFLFDIRSAKVIAPVLGSMRILLVKRAIGRNWGHRRAYKKGDHRRRVDDFRNSSRGDSRPVS